MICFYHSADLDGHCSGALVKKVFPEISLYGIDYGDEFPWELCEGEDVIMVDFSLQPFEKMVRLNEIAKLEWIDHHKSAIAAMVKSGKHFFGKWDVKYAACELTWIYLHGPAHDIPMYVQMIGRHDVWDHSDPLVVPFNYGLRTYETDPAKDMEVWDSLAEEDPAKIAGVLQRGISILAYKEQEWLKRAEKMSFTKGFEGHKALVINHSMEGSSVLDTIFDPGVHDLMLTFAWDGRGWNIGLYTSKDGVDVSEIAARYGGGGHAGAAGFQCKELPFML